MRTDTGGLPHPPRGEGNRYMRILRIGLERFKVPEKVSDRMIGGAISVLRALEPCGYDGEPREYDRDLRIEYECINGPVAGPRRSQKTKREAADDGKSK